MFGSIAITLLSIACIFDHSIDTSFVITPPHENGLAARHLYPVSPHPLKNNT
jgi:hypothetical protein